MSIIFFYKILTIESKEHQIKIIQNQITESLFDKSGTCFF